VLTGDQKTRLKAIQNSKSVDGIPDYQDLLFNLSLLEYRNGEPKPWYDAHPIVQDLL
jgi:hypothetical protein